MRIALLYPEVYDIARFRRRRKEFPPFGILYLAAALERAGYDVQIEKVSPGKVTYDLLSYDAIGFSLSSSATYGHMLEVRRHSHTRDDALIMVGGVHCNLYPQDSLNDFKAHVAAIGESEEVIVEVLARAGSRLFDGIPGILWRQGSSLRDGGPRRLIPNIDNLPLPARHLLPVNDFIVSDRLAGTNTRMAHVMFSRGCPFSCNFCAAAQRKTQYRSGASARLELNELVRQYGIGGFAIVDDNFIVNKTKVADICEAIGDLRLKWSALARVDVVERDLLVRMAASGCIEIKYGIESGSEKLLRAMNKNTTRKQIEQAIRSTVSAGIGVKVFLIHGFPGENQETTQETINLLRQLAPDISRVSLFRFVPLPGAAVYERAAAYAIRGTHHQPDWDHNWSKFHIHHNNRHWWGSKDDWAETQSSYTMLKSFVEEQWGAQS